MAAWAFSAPGLGGILWRRAPISREVMLGSSGGPFSGFCSCPATHASSRDTTTVQTAATPGGGEHGVDGVAAGVGKVIAAHAVMFLEMADDGLNGGTPIKLALDLRRDAALLAGRVDLELVIERGVVAAIAGIGDTAIENVADERLHLGYDRAQRVPLIGIAGQCCGMGDKLPAGAECFTVVATLTLTPNS